MTETLDLEAIRKLAEDDIAAHAHYNSVKVGYKTDQATTPLNSSTVLALLERVKEADDKAARCDHAMRVLDQELNIKLREAEARLGVAVEVLRDVAASEEGFYIGKKARTALARIKEAP